MIRARWIFLLFFGIQFRGFSQVGLFPCGGEGKFGFCDEAGKAVIEPIFEKVQPFQGYLAPVSIEGIWWMINQFGLHRFNSRLSSDGPAPILERGLYKVEYFDPIFANVTEYYNQRGLPVKLLESTNPYLDTLPYLIFNPAEATRLAQSKLGLPYGFEGLDCSGFIRFIFSNFGIVLPYYTREIAEKGRPIGEQQLKIGDLILFKGANLNDPTPNHVGMVFSVKGKEVKFIHASTSKGISINSLTDGYYKSRLLRFRRIFD
jgi:hypothetical protein